METSSRKTTPITAPVLPTRQSSRKIVKKEYGSDYIEDFPVRGSLNVLPTPVAPTPSRRSAPVKRESSVKPIQPMKRARVATVETPPANSFRDVCLECLKRKPNSVLLRCTTRGCNYAAHAEECLHLTKDKTVRIKERFQCLSCKRCSVCQKGITAPNDSVNHSNFVSCVSCDAVCHERCHSSVVESRTPELKDKYSNNSSWKCAECKGQSEKRRHPLEDSVSFTDVTDITDVTGCHSSGQPENGATNGHFHNSSTEDGSLLSNASDGVMRHQLPNEASGSAPFGLTLPNNASKESFPTENEEDWSAEDPGKNGHDYISTTILVEEAEKKFASKTENFENLKKIKEKTEENKIKEKTEKKEEKEKTEKKHRLGLALLSVEECSLHFTENYPELGELIRKHGLYGSSLVLLSRPQFIDLFGLTLGAALKMHHAVCKWRKAFF